MVAKKPRIVIIGAGMAGLTAANKLYTTASSKDLFELCVVEGGTRIGGRINTSEFGGDRIEMGATWIHGIGGSPIHKIAQDIHSLESEQPWECMDGYSDHSKTIAEGGFELDASIVDPITKIFKTLMDHARGKSSGECARSELCLHNSKLAAKAYRNLSSSSGNPSVGGFLREGLEAYWGSVKEREELRGYGNWSRKLLQEAIFAMHENTQRTYTSAGDLSTLDFNAESEYQMFPGEEITIAKGYLAIIGSLASVLPPGLIQLGKKVSKIEWQPERHEKLDLLQNVYCSRPVKLHFSDGSCMSADHIIVTVSLGVLKAAVLQDSGLFYPPLPPFKAEAISRLGFGVVNKLFLQLSPTYRHIDENTRGFPFLQMVFHPSDCELRHKKIPWWMRRSATLCPIYNNSRVLLSWFVGEEAFALESLKEEEILNGVSTTVSSLLSHSHKERDSSHKFCNGNLNFEENSHESEVIFSKVLRSQWGTDPLFLGSYSYVAVGSSGDDFDTMAEPLPQESSYKPSDLPPLQILFAGEATHRTHYSTTHGAYYSGLREANRLLEHYQSVGIYDK